METVVITEEDQKSYQELVTRASSYSKPFPLECAENEPPSPNHKSFSKRNTLYLKCKVHNPISKKNDHWKPENTECPSCFVFNPSNSLPNGILPTNLSVIQNLISYKDILAKKGQKCNVAADYSVSKDVALHWIFCNVYPITLQCIQRKVEILFDEFIHLKDYVHKKKKDKYWNDLSQFTEKLSSIFDIRADETQTKKQEKLWKCVMSSDDKKFYEMQCGNPPKGYCDTFVDKKWKKMKARKEARENRSREEHYEFIREEYMLNDMEESSCQKDLMYTGDTEEAGAKKKYDYQQEINTNDNELPFKYRHLRSSLQDVRPEVYQVIAKMKSKYHMSQVQAEGAIVEVGNILFGRNWKFYDKDLPTNCNTLPAGSNMRRVEPYIEAMALSSIVEEIMTGEKMTVTYSNDGSAMSGVGKYVVQSLTINKVQRVLPTFSIFSESRDSLK